MDFQHILGKIKPAPQEQERVHRLVEGMRAKIRIKGAEVVLGGSGAKDTWLKGTHDLDLYVAFNYQKYKDRSKNLADILHKALKRLFSQVLRLHGSRDYFQIKGQNYTIEIVPILAIQKAEQAKNITDVSLLHVHYVQKHRRLADEIRLAKQFAKAQEVYGAESYIRGFSGYVMELLVIHYGSFMKLVKAASAWKEKEIIGDKKKVAELNEAKTQSPLIFLDPVQPERNASAAVSEEKYRLFVSACKKFLKHPSATYFEEQDVNVNALKKKGYLTIISASLVSEKKDVAGAKAVKALHRISQLLSEYNVKYIHHKIKNQDVIYYVVTEKNVLPAQKISYGPPLAFDNEKALINFKNTHKKAVIRKDTKTKRYIAIERQKQVPLAKALAAIISSPYVKERLKNPRIQRT